MYASFVRFEHTLFSLPLILAGVFSVAGEAMGAARWALGAVAAVGARTAAMTLNRVIDRRHDARNPRTRTRELPAGRMKLAEAVALLVGSVAVYVAACAALGPWYLQVAAVPFAVFAAYPYLKRFTPLCHAGVGVAMSLSALAGWAVAHPDLAQPGPAVGLALVLGFTVAPHVWLGYAYLYKAYDTLKTVFVEDTTTSTLPPTTTTLWDGGSTSWSLICRPWKSYLLLNHSNQVNRSWPAPNQYPHPSE